MKLLNRTTVYYIIVAFTLVGILAIVQYQLASSKIDTRLERALLKEKDLVVRQLNAGENYTGIDWFKSERISLADTGTVPLTELEFYVTEEFDSVESDFVRWRVLHYVFPDRKEQQHLYIKRSYSDTTAFIESIFLSSLLLIFGLILVYVLVNRWLVSRLWMPFYDTLGKLKNFDIDSPEKVELTPTAITEFSALNSEVEELINKIRKDYRKQKEFIEHASHEFQTPLAVMRSKAELILQAENVSEKQGQLVESLLITIDRLSRLNRSLVLLSKIEHGQYDDIQSVDFAELLASVMEQFEHVAALKQLRIEQILDGKPKLEMSYTLAEILVMNLVKNAVRHTAEGGLVKVQLSDHTFRVINEGQPLNLDPKTIFGRFIKDSENPESTGLGLAIVKEICTISNLKINYEYSKGFHCFTVS